MWCLFSHTETKYTEDHWGNCGIYFDLDWPPLLKVSLQIYSHIICKNIPLCLWFCHNGEQKQQKCLLHIRIRMHHAHKGVTFMGVISSYLLEGGDNEMTWELIVKEKINSTKVSITRPLLVKSIRQERSPRIQLSCLICASAKSKFLSQNETLLKGGQVGHPIPLFHPSFSSQFLMVVVPGQGSGPAQHRVLLGLPRRAFSSYN